MEDIEPAPAAPVEPAASTVLDKPADTAGVKAVKISFQQALELSKAKALDKVRLTRWITEAVCVTDPAGFEASLQRLPLTSLQAIHAALKDRA